MQLSRPTRVTGRRERHDPALATAARQTGAVSTSSPARPTLCPRSGVNCRAKARFSSRPSSSLPSAQGSCSRSWWCTCMRCVASNRRIGPNYRASVDERPVAELHGRRNATKRATSEIGSVNPASNAARAAAARPAADESPSAIGPMSDTSRRKFGSRSSAPPALSSDVSTKSRLAATSTTSRAYTDATAKMVSRRACMYDNVRPTDWATRRNLSDRVRYSTPLALSRVQGPGSRKMVFTSGVAPSPTHHRCLCATHRGENPPSHTSGSPAGCRV